VGEFEVGVFFVVFALATIFAVFWVIRLAVRYGTNDALRMNRHWLGSQNDQNTRTH